MSAIPQVPIAPETIFTMGTFPITNTFINAAVATLIFVIVALIINTRLRLIPGRFQSICETLIETLLDYFDRVTGDRKKSKLFLPLAGTMFFFILLSNWLSLMPGTGSIGVYHVEAGEQVFVPLFRPANSDLNLTLALALISLFVAHGLGVASNGVWKHANRFLNVAGIWKAIKTLKPVNILVALVEFLVGIIEFFGEFAKIASLSLRLFGNIFAGEVLMTVMSSLFAFGLPLPFMALESVVGIVQATVFTMLTVVYLTTLSAPPHGEAGHEQAVAAAH